MNLEITTDAKKVVATLDKLANNTANFSKPLHDISKLLLSEIQENFGRQGALYQGGGFVRAGGAFSNSGSATTRSQPWAPLKPSTVSQRVALGFPGTRPILVRTGRLKRGFRIQRILPDELTITNKVPYGVFHQLGTDRIPQRKVMGFSNKSLKAIEQILKNHIHGMLSR